jgi:hypothetical protein
VTVAKTILPDAEEPSLRRWMIAGTTVVLIHAAIAFCARPGQHAAEIGDYVGNTRLNECDHV